jgi:hypothetical protein
VLSLSFVNANGLYQSYYTIQFAAQVSRHPLGGKNKSSSLGDATMRRITCILILVCVPLIHGTAQISIACQGGANFANLTDPGNLAPGAVWSTQIGFVGLVSVDFRIGAGWSLSPGVRFVQKGTRSDWSLSPYGAFAINVYYDYVEMPVYLKYVLIENHVRLSLLMGPSVGYLISSRAKGTITSEGNVSFDLTEDYKSFDCSADAGLECQTPLSETIAIVGSATYSLGLVRINRRDSREQTRDIRLTVGVSYSVF